MNFPPISLDKPGQYMLWIQAKTEGEIPDAVQQKQSEASVPTRKTTFRQNENQ